MPEFSLRTFIAIELDPAMLASLGRLQETYRKVTPHGSVKWVEPEGIHLTLKFLGDTPPERARAIREALQRAAAGIAPFTITAEGRGCFPNFRRPRVIWVAVRSPGNALAELQSAVEREVSPLGWPPEERGFSPHLTLGRISRYAGPENVATVGQAVERSVVEVLGSQEVRQVSLIRSDLRPSGAVYTPLANIPLGNPAAG